MKAIISHDIDYITFWEHKTDLVIPKFVIRNFIEWGSGLVSAGELGRRYRAFLRNKFQNTEEQMAFDAANGVPSTFFVAVNRGRDNLSYSLAAARYWIQKIRASGFDVGVHGIAHETAEGVKREFRTFRDILGADSFGVRIHWVRTVEGTLGYLRDAGYLFDSTVVDRMEDPYRIGGMWEFPLHVMDSFIMNHRRPWLTRRLEQAKDATKRIIQEAEDKGLKYLNVLSHDIFFSDAFLTWKKWYVWLIDYLQQNGFAFVSYKQAIQELEQGSSYT